MTVQRSARQPLSSDSPSIRWSFLAERVLGRWDWTGRAVVLAFALTACITVVLLGLGAAAGLGTAAVTAGVSVLATVRATRQQS